MDLFDPTRDDPPYGATVDFGCNTFTYTYSPAVGWWATDRSLYSRPFSKEGVALTRLWVAQGRPMVAADQPVSVEPLTVGALISQLQEMDPGLLVTLEGCDCDGAAGRAEVSSINGKSYAYIRRTGR